MSKSNKSNPIKIIILFLVLITIITLVGSLKFIMEYRNGSGTGEPKEITQIRQENNDLESNFIKSVSELDKKIKKDCPLNVLFERTINGKTHVIYNDKDMGEGLVYGLAGNKPLYWDKDDNIIYDGKNYGKGSSVAIDGDSVAFVRYGYDENKSWQPHIIYNGENIGIGNGPMIDKGHLVFIKEGHIIYDGKDLGEGEIPQLKGDDIVYLVNSSYYDKSQVIYNGKNLGKIWGSGSLHLYDDGVFFSRQGGKSAWYNGEELREIEGLIRGIEGDDILLEKVKDGHNHVFLNGKDFGEGGNAQMKNGHIAWVDGEDIYFDGIYIGKGQGVGVDGKNILYRSNGEDKGGLIFNGNNLSAAASTFLSTLIEDNIVFTKDGNLFCNSHDLGKYTCDSAHAHMQCLYSTLSSNEK